MKEGHQGSGAEGKHGEAVKVLVPAGDGSGVRAPTGAADAATAVFFFFKAVRVGALPSFLFPTHTG